MILFHGSNTVIDRIELAKSKPNKDFGQGFYLSADETQAKEMLQIRKLKDGSIDKTEFLNRLKYMKGITFQYFFGSEAAIKHLTRI